MPRWVRGAAGAAVLLALLAPHASGQPTEGTAVEGDVPADLVGRWLVVEQNRLQGGMVHPFARLWEIRQGRDHLELILRRVRLPEALSAKLVAAGSANRSWIPADGDLRALAERWGRPSRERRRRPTDRPPAGRPRRPPAGLPPRNWRQEPRDRNRGALLGIADGQDQPRRVHRPRACPGAPSRDDRERFNGRDARAGDAHAPGA